MKRMLVMCLVVWLGLFVIQASDQKIRDNEYSLFKEARAGVEGQQESATPGVAKNERTTGNLSTVQAGLEFSLNRDRLNFGAAISGEKTGSQTLIIDCPEIANLHWTVTDDADWLDYSPASGTNSGMVSVWVEPAGLSPGTYTGTITVSSPPATPQTVTVKLVVYSSTTGPFGTVDSPINGTHAMGSIPVTGWALDDIGFKEIMIYRMEYHYGKSQEIYIGTGLFVDDARPDVENAYPNYPMNYGAGWGYMLLTNCLPNEGNGTFTIHADGIDLEGNRVPLGSRIIFCVNASAVKPFGTIDLPFSGRIASGKKYWNVGWLLTPMPDKIPEDGSTITLYIDGLPRDNQAFYNVYRPDVLERFPGYANSEGAGAYFYIDTTTFENGVHTIQWTVSDDNGDAAGIGSRYFRILNSATASTASRVRVNFPGMLEEIPGDLSAPLEIKRGYGDEPEVQTAFPDENGTIVIEIEELEPLQIRLNPSDPSITSTSNRYRGYLMVGDQLRGLPAGSMLNAETGVFSWGPGPGYIETYRLVFIETGPMGRMNKRLVNVKIVPKSCK